MLTSMRPRLAEIATRADVSEATVSRVLNARPGVANNTRRKVLDVLADLGYEDIHRQHTGSGAIGIVTPELTNPFFPHLAQHIESVLAHHGYISMVCSSTAETVHEQDFLDFLLAQRSSGVVVVNGRYALPGVGYGPYQNLVDHGVPVVLVNGFSGAPPVAAVGINVADAASSAVRYLGSLGHERIGLVVGPTRYPTANDFVTGYRAGLATLGLGFDESLVSETPWTIEGGQAAAAPLLERGVTGVVCSNDLMAVGVVAAAHAWGASVPEDLSVVGFDGSPLISFTDPPLTTLRQPAALMATAIASLLVGDHRNSTRVPTQRFRAELVIGQSTGRPKVRV
jgi:LacI family transcriptional regulator, repressor for deo operon, udp, cdd, tsx, nupC, and nupG